MPPEQLLPTQLWPDLFFLEEFGFLISNSLQIFPPSLCTEGCICTWPLLLAQPEQGPAHTHDGFLFSPPMRVPSMNIMVQAGIWVRSVPTASSTVGILDQDVLLDSWYCPEVMDACPGCLLSVFALKPHSLWLLQTWGDSAAHCDVKHTVKALTQGATANLILCQYFQGHFFIDSKQYRELQGDKGGYKTGQSAFLSDYHSRSYLLPVSNKAL